MGTGKIEYLDFIKGFAAISVVLLHALPIEYLEDSFAYIHIWQAVPLFVFISFYLFFRKLDTGISYKDYYSINNIKKIAIKVLLPFGIVQILFGIITYEKNGIEGLIDLFKHFGYGRGAYYPYIYCQIWLVAPFLYMVLKKADPEGNVASWGGVIIAVISVACNVAESFCPLLLSFDSRLLTRYLFLSYVAWRFYLNKENLIWRYLLPIFSILYWIYGMNYDLDPWIITQTGWRSQQLPAYFYTFFFVYLFYKITPICCKGTKLFLTWAGSYSYYIFLLQMVFFYFLSLEKFSSFVDVVIADNTMIVLGYSFCAVICTITPIFLYDRLKIVLKKQIQ